MVGPIGSILGFFSKPLDTVLKKKLKDVNKVEEFKHEIAMEVMRLPFQERMAFEKRLQLEAQHPNLLRDSVRPIITYCAWAFYMVYKFITLDIMTKAFKPLMYKLTEGTPEQVFQNIDKIRNIMNDYSGTIFTDADLYILLTILGFWFGSKLFERVIDTTAKTGGIRAFFGVGQRKTPPGEPPE